jgi:hypothetical protein
MLIAIKVMVPLTRPSMLAMNVAKSSMWTIAALVSLNVLVRGSNNPIGSKSVRSAEPGQAAH